MNILRNGVIIYLITTFTVLSCDYDSNITKTQIVEYDYYETYTAYNVLDNGIYHLDTPGNVNLNYTLELDTYIKDVYFIFTNTDLDSSSTLSNITEQNSIIKSETLDYNIIKNVDNNLIRGKPGITEFNKNPLLYLPANDNKTQSDIISNKTLFTKSDIIGNGQVFMIDSYTSVYAICACKVTDSTNSRTLNIWIADDCWANTPGEKKTFVVNETMVNKLAQKFLNDGTDNDIYDWVTGIFGEEWGSWTTESYDTRLIPPDNNITILLFDINNDDAKFLTGNTGICSGYYWAKDNYLSSSFNFSNQRIMFYADAVLFACPYPVNLNLPDPYVNWDIDDIYPAETVFTLAHELQHMIHFYQKNILRTDNEGSATWINEMCSLITEDFISTKLGGQYKGPRGISGDTAHAQSAGITSGRLPCYVYYNDSSLVKYNMLNPLPSYANSYSFAAYLARNFGGARFFRDIVYNIYTDEESINFAMQQQSNGINAIRAIQQWAVSVLLSDNLYNVNSPGIYDGYILNNGDNWFTSTVGDHTYSLGSVNMFNYIYFTGLEIACLPDVVYDISENDYCCTMPAGSNRIVLAGKDLTGLHSWNFLLNENTKLTVVCK